MISVCGSQLGDRGPDRGSASIKLPCLARRLDKQQSTVPPNLYVSLKTNCKNSSSHGKSLLVGCCLCIQDSILCTPCIPGKSVEMARN